MLKLVFLLAGLVAFAHQYTDYTRAAEQTVKQEISQAMGDFIPSARR